MEGINLPQMKMETRIEAREFFKTANMMEKLSKRIYTASQPSVDNGTEFKNAAESVPQTLRVKNALKLVGYSN